MIKTTGKFYTDLATPIVVGANENVPLQNGIVSNNCLSLSNNEIEIKATGLYQILVNVTTQATAVCANEIILQADGTDIDGAVGLGSATAIGDYINIAFSTIKTVVSGTSGTFAKLSLLNVNATSILKANVIVIKIA